MTRQESAQHHFAANPKEDIFYVTSDGQCFRTWHDANNHSRSMSDRSIEEFKRKDSTALTIADKVAAIEAVKTSEELAEIKLGSKPSKAEQDAHSKKKKELEDKNNAK